MPQNNTDNLLLRAHTCVLQSKSTQSRTEGQGSQRFGRPNAAGGIHTCVAEQIDPGHVNTLIISLNPYPLICTPASRLQRLGRSVVAVSKHLRVAGYVSSGLHPTFKVYKIFADQMLLRAYTCVLQKSHLHQRVEILIRTSPTNCCCQHTHVCCRMDHLELQLRIKGYKGSPDQLLQRAYTCALQNKSNHGCTQGSKFFQGFADQLLLSAYTCVLQNGSLVAPKDQGLQELLQRAYTCALQNKSNQGYAQGSTRVRPTSSCWHAHVARCRTDEFKVAPKVKGSKVWPTNCCLEHTHTLVCCRICQFKAAPVDQELQGLAGHGRTL